MHSSRMRTARSSSRHGGGLHTHTHPGAGTPLAAETPPPPEQAPALPRSRHTPWQQTPPPPEQAPPPPTEFFLGVPVVIICLCFPRRYFIIDRFFFPESLNTTDPLITTRVDETGQQIIIVSGTQDFDGLTGKGF